MENRRTRFWGAGAIAAPDGVEAATPSGRVSGAAAVPVGFCGADGACCGSPGEARFVADDGWGRGAAGAEVFAEGVVADSSGWAFVPCCCPPCGSAKLAATAGGTATIDIRTTAINPRNERCQFMRSTLQENFGSSDLFPWMHALAELVPRTVRYAALGSEERRGAS